MRRDYPFPPNLPFNGRQLLCMVMAGVDDMARDVLTALNSKRMLDDILVVHASDNGGVRSFGSKNGGQQGRTRSFLEGGVRVPAFISGSVVSSSHNLKGTSYDGSMHVTDLFATIVGIAERREAFYTKKLNGDFLGTLFR
mmetsp:Transcript_10805/g.16435  ORF Transcript_10805/g.16435 Transcript_10805/m.16435 type:complete len:140 (-) Transcript_10805:414-833(-)